MKLFKTSLHSMVDCICKICTNGLREATNNLAQSKPVESILKTLKDKYSLECNRYILKRHLEAFGIEPISAIDRMPSMGLETEDVRYHAPIDLDDLSLERWKLSKDEPAAIVSFLQEKLLCLGFQQMEVVASQQREYLDGHTHTEPSKESISNLRVLLSLADKFTSISLQANQQQAVRIVQALGYEAEDLRSLPGSNTAS
jgi:hypothetical protein